MPTIRVAAEAIPRDHMPRGGSQARSHGAAAPHSSQGTAHGGVTQRVTRNAGASG